MSKSTTYMAFTVCHPTPSLLTTHGEWQLINETPKQGTHRGRSTIWLRTHNVCQDQRVVLRIQTLESGLNLS